MSIAEDNFLGSESSARTHQTIDRAARSGTQPKAYERDVFKRIRTADICRVSRHLATLLRAGMPLVPALTALVEQLRETQAKDNPLADIMEQVGDDVNSGKTLSGALGKHPDIFSGLFVSMVAAGETSGTLEEILVRLAEILEKRVHLMAKIKAAVAYPLMMIVVAVAVVVFLMAVVVPDITMIFVEMNRPLPWPTKLLISISAFMRTYWVFLVILIFALFLGIGAAYRIPKGRYWIDRSKLRLPLFGKLFLKLEITRLSRTLGILLASGIPILGALDIVRQVVQNRFIADSLGSV
ncbi:MAG: type II secretion system F family protein, partial [Sedimentisphaerales bacterium]|nr:type II secretion system F family protein [Sedimentisphaerales bacterium]